MMPPRYKVTKLNFRAEALNNRGQVAGARQDDAVVWESGKPERRVRSWTTVTGGMISCYGINTAGEVVGADKSRPFRWRPGENEVEYVPLPKGDLGGSVFAINDAGDAIGEVSRPPRTAALVRWNAKAADYEVLTTVLTLEPPHINNRGQMAGTFFSTGEERPFVWERGRFREIKELRGCRFTGINDRGVIAGVEGKQAFLWQHGRRTDLSKKREAGVSTGLNNRGQVVSGWMLWQDGRAHDLRALAEGLPRTEEELEAFAINDRGQILLRDNLLLTPK